MLKSFYSKLSLAGAAAALAAFATTPAFAQEVPEPGCSSSILCCSSWAVSLSCLWLRVFVCSGLVWCAKTQPCN